MLSTLLVPFLVAVAVSLVLVPVCRLVALRLGQVAAPTSNRWHRKTTALFGGVAIALTVLACVAALFGVREYAILLACSTAIFVVGFADDVVSLRVSTKLVTEIAIASVFVFFQYRLGWTESLTLDSLLTIVWIVGITNAFNLLDNMDGLCAGVALLAGGAWLVAAWPADVTSPAYLEARYLAVVLGATAGFLVYNLHPASVFMGDSGALFLGLNFAVVTLAPRGTGRWHIESPVGGGVAGTRPPGPYSRHDPGHAVAGILGPVGINRRSGPLVASTGVDRPVRACGRRGAVGTCRSGRRGSGGRTSPRRHMVEPPRSRLPHWAWRSSLRIWRGSRSMKTPTSG